MSLKNKSVIRKVYGITDDELKEIEKFLQKKVSSWIENYKDEAFAARDLVGGENSDWRGTPLQCLYEKHVNHEIPKPHEKAVKAAAIDLGWILKNLLDKCTHKFDSFDAGKAKGYKLIK